MVSEARKQSMAWMETDYSKHTHFRWKIKWRLELLGALRIMGETTPLRGFLSVNALRACVYIYMRQLSSFRAPTLWFIALTVATCHIQYTFLSLCPFFARENGQNTKILEVRHFGMTRKWPPIVIRCAKH